MSPEEWAKREGLDEEWAKRRGEPGFVYLTFMEHDEGTASLVIRYREQSMSIPFGKTLARRLVEICWAYLRTRL